MRRLLLGLFILGMAALLIGLTSWLRYRYWAKALFSPTARWRLKRFLALAAGFELGLLLGVWLALTGIQTGNRPWVVLGGLSSTVLFCGFFLTNASIYRLVETQRIWFGLSRFAPLPDEEEQVSA